MGSCCRHCCFSSAVGFRLPFATSARHRSGPRALDNAAAIGPLTLRAASPKLPGTPTSAPLQSRPMPARPLGGATALPASGHVPTLDGVRGLAIAMVLAVHLAGAWPAITPAERFLDEAFTLGWTGVDLFFALSGFLITGILLTSRAAQSDEPSRYFGDFMWRRALRIFPLYYAALIVLFVLVPATGVVRDSAYNTLLGNQEWYWLYGVNVLLAVQGGDATPMLTSHFWSLAVEEQFYLVWPVVVWFAGPRRLVWVAATLWCGSVVGRFGVTALQLPLENPAALMPLRLDPLMAGALVALAARSPTWWPRLARVAPAALLVGASTVVALVFWSVDYGRDERIRASLLYVAIAVTSGALVAYAVQTHATGRAGLLRGRALATLGKYSYCLYVVHFPLMNAIDRVVPRLDLPTMWGTNLPYVAVYAVLMVTISLGISWVSWRVLESPVLKFKDQWRRLPTVLEPAPPVADARAA